MGQSFWKLFPGYSWFMGTVEGTKNCLYSIKFEDGEENNCSEVEKMKYTEEAHIPM